MSSFLFRFKQIYPVFLVITAVLLSACSYNNNPASVLKYSAGETLLIDRVKIERQRQFVIPTFSQVAWLVGSDGEFDEDVYRGLVNDGLYTFSHVFAAVTAIDSSQTIPNEIDFLIKAKLIDARTRGGSQGGIQEEGSTQTAGNHAPPHRRLLPYTALMKLELFDARSLAPLDVTIVQARSGALGSSQFSHLLRQGLRAYSKSLTHTHKKRY